MLEHNAWVDNLLGQTLLLRGQLEINPSLVVTVKVSIQQLETELSSFLYKGCPDTKFKLDTK